MIIDKSKIFSIITYCLYDAYKAGTISENDQGNLTMDMLYDFTLVDIIGVFTYKKGVGNGIWFQLSSGRICSQSGKAEVGASFTDYQ